MPKDFLDTFLAVAIALVGLATIAVVFSPKAATSKVIGASFRGLSSAINAAVSPVTGSFGGITGMGMPLE